MTTTSVPITSAPTRACLARRSYKVGPAARQEKPPVIGGNLIPPECRARHITP